MIDFTIRNAVVEDVPLIAEIIKTHAETGVMLQRPVSRIYDAVRDYLLVEVDGEVVGCGAVHVMWSDLAEIRAVALKKEWIGKGLGRPLIDALIVDAKLLGTEKVFVLTYQIDFFRKLGFSEVDKSELPHKIWADCINCVHFPNCDETAMMRTIM